MNHTWRNTVSNIGRGNNFNKTQKNKRMLLSYYNLVLKKNSILPRRDNNNLEKHF